ncbi:MAG: hypothetical protein HC892_20925 [Saprospiraceae bacterium]|nr:hypothetical protein [Saprospiraceae bacterium]
MFKSLCCSASLIFFVSALAGKSDKFRCTWRDDPATTMVVGWNQITGSNAVLYYDVANRGSNSNYTFSQKPDVAVGAKGMNNLFVRLKGLKPNTTYFFVIADSEGYSKVMSFQTAPATPNERLSVIAGGDSRNFREARRKANSTVSKLRAHVVLFDGDMTGGDTNQEWQEWLNDWQLTISSDGRLTPVLVARGNHEADNATLVHLFDVPSKEIYYALNFGGNLFRVYTLNSMIPSGGAQKEWLEKDLKSSDATWKMAMYHHSIRPHTKEKEEQLELYKNWASIFYEQQVHLVMESDAHVVKITYPIRPSTETGNDEGYVRDDARGTVYIGEGCWGAPLRTNDDNKSWTRDSGRFNQFKLIFVDENKIEIRTVMTDESENAKSVPADNIFQLPEGLQLWQPKNGALVTIPRRNPPKIHEPLAVSNPTNTNSSSTTAASISKPAPSAAILYVDSKTEMLQVKYELKGKGEVGLHLLNKNMQRVKTYQFFTRKRRHLFGIYGFVWITSRKIHTFGEVRRRYFSKI